MKQATTIQALLNDSRLIAPFFLALLLISADFFYISLHIGHQLGFFHTDLYLLTKDRGFPEFFQYTKELWAVILLIIVLLRTKEIGYVFWIAMFTYFLLDDSLMLHEKIGDHIAIWLSLTPVLELEPDAIGEVIGVVALGAPILLAVILAYRTGSDSFRKATKHLSTLVFALLFFGVIVDLIGGIVGFNQFGKIRAGIEDGGEMIVMSFIVSYVYWLSLHIGLRVRS